MDWLRDSKPVILALVVQGLLIGGRNQLWLLYAAPLISVVATLMLILIVVLLTIAYMILACKKVLFYDYEPFWPILFGLLVLTVPEGLIRAGFCVHSFRYATNDNLVRYAIDAEIRKTKIDPTITTAEQFYERYGRECCFVADYNEYFRNDSLPWEVRMINDYFMGPASEVILNYGSQIRHIEVAPCGSIGEAYTEHAELMPHPDRKC